MMYKKINVFIIGFFSILTIYSNIGFMLYIPLLLYYLIRNIKNIYVFTLSGVLGLIFSFLIKSDFVKSLTTYMIPFLLLIILMLFILWIMNKLVKSIYIYFFLILLNVIMQLVFQKQIDDLLVFMINTGISVLLYAFLERNLIESLTTKNIFFNSSYVEIIISLIAIIGAANLNIYNLNLGLVLSIYFTMYFGQSYKNIYSILYSLITSFIMMFLYKQSDAILLLMITPFYFMRQSFPLLFTNIFCCGLLFVDTNINNLFIIVIMVTSLVYEVIKRFVSKETISDRIITDNIYSQMTSNISNEVLGFAGFLDKFVESFKEPVEFTTVVNDSIKTLLNNNCNNCHMKKECFAYYKTNLYLYLKNLILNNNVSTKEYQYFLNNCIRIREIKDEAIRLNQRINFNNLSTNNNTLIVQLIGVSNAIRKYAIDMVAKQEINTRTIFNFKEQIIAYGYDLTYFEVVKAFEDDFMFEFGISDNDKKEIIKNITTIGNNLFKKTVSIIFLKEEQSISYFRMIPEVKVEILYGYGSLSANQNNICGDNYIIKELNNGRFISAISDGMGKGYQAFCESNNVLNLVSAIVEQSLEVTTALEILNTFYAIQEYLEKYSTLDLLEINRYNKTAKFFKMGATTSYIIKKNGTLQKIINQNLPFGIEDAIDNKELILEDEDLILMSSDGIFENLVECKELDDFIKKIRGETPQKIVFEILNYTINNEIKTNDDATLIALKIKMI